MTSAGQAGWNPHLVLHRDGEAVARELPAQQQIVTESWNRVVAVPYIVFMPEKVRVLMLVGCDYPHQPFTVFSDDHGATWSDPRPISPDLQVNAAAGLGTSLTYLGQGKVAFSGGGRWFSNDYGETWQGPEPIPPAAEGGKAV